MIIPPVSTHNDCRYCRMIHTNALEAMGPRGSDRQCYQGCQRGETSPLATGDRRVHQQSRQGSQVDFSGDDVKISRQDSMSNGEIKEAAMIAAFANFINTWAGVSGVLIDRKEESA